ncbi:DUF4253 domain-containing protein [Bradyrhizobium ontarionense]|uniref:DUF4253 domain-containing protein n=1 Tax=Bradyrhizobium ontarionense TaxID=2898149 RepID=A0ABY3RNW0_9BRAD|nr:DUF4253 domain-containing protein [Bradyrhizobium sp. A19]UFZ08283.1 DUF4253 domain-containing protein [Bradyrhizobium sp. A19]
MRRRDILRGLFAGALGAAMPWRARAVTPDEIAQNYQRQAIERFPLKLVETTGDNALAKWQELKAAGQGIPVVLGGEDEHHSLGNLLTPFGPNGPYGPPLRSVEEILQKAAEIRFPDDLAARNVAGHQAAVQHLKDLLAAKPDMPLPVITETKDGKTRTLTRDETIAAMVRDRHEPPIGEWPDRPETGWGLSVAEDTRTGQPLQKVIIGLAPTDDWTTIPALLRWGDWNGCPKPEEHVAALRSWRDRYGAELVGMSADTINLRVASRPKTREEALALAREHYVYCNDIIDQGAETLSALAAALMANDWWYFWWD